MNDNQRIAWEAYKTLDETYIKLQEFTRWSKMKECLECVEALVEAKRAYVSAMLTAGLDPQDIDKLNDLRFQSIQ